MKTKKLVLSGVLLAVALCLPFFTGQIPQIGAMLSPMHIPVLLCGFICGAPYGIAVGAIAPILRFALFGMPPIYPTGLAMMFELATYGACCGLLHAILPKRPMFAYVTLVSAMIVGRLVWGVTMFFLTVNFSLDLFLAGALFNAIPGIILHIVVIPPILFALQKRGLVLNG